MNDMANVFYSNRVEVLYRDFKRNLFENSHPLTRRLVIVPSPAVKNWLMLQMASDPDLGVSTGVEIGFIDSILNRLCELFAADQGIQEKVYEPSELEISLALEKEIEHVITSHLAKSELWKPLLDYLNIPASENEISRKTIKRISSLSSSLGRLFLDYGMYGGRVVEAWATSGYEGWQEQLWKSLETRFDKWNYPYRKLETMQLNATFDSSELQIHVFALSYLAPLHHRFLMRVNQYVPLHYYMISPCQKFWSDVVSDKESVRLQAYWQQRGVGEAQQLALEEYLRDSNPLLANFGRLGREMALQVEECPLETVERYALPDSVASHEAYSELIDGEMGMYSSYGPLTLLEAVQADMALLRNPDRAEKVSFGEYDGTVQVHAVSKPIREVQVIYDVILGIIRKHLAEGDPITPGDMIVMAPNIMDYAPFILSVFGGAESVLDYQVMDFAMPARISYIQAFMHLMQLPQGRWDSASILELFENPVFRKRHGLTLEDVAIFREWIKVVGIRWGKDVQHRNEMLKRDHCSRGMVEEHWHGTWEEGLGRLCEGLAMISDEGRDGVSVGRYCPVDAIEGTQGELLGRVLQLLRSLLEDLRVLNDNTMMRVSHWAVYLRCLCEAYFSAVDAEDEEGYRILGSYFQKLEEASGIFAEETFAFSSISLHFQKVLKKEKVNYRESHLHAVRFCSMLPMRAIPAKVIILMGMQDGAFPRQGDHLSLNLLLSSTEADYYPSQVDFDRYIFLEALLSSRRYLIMSYISYSPGADAKEAAPSLLLTELMGYLDRAYRIPEGKISEQCLMRHPFLSFDKQYFSTSSRYVSYSKSNYEAAVAHYLKEKVSAHSFFTSFAAPGPSVVDDAYEVVVEMRDLVSFARNPLKVFLNKTLGIYLDREEDRLVKSEEEMQISALECALLSRQGVALQISEVLHRAQKIGRVPSGPFKHIGMEKVRQEVNILKANLLKYGIGDGQTFSIEFSEKYLEANIDGRIWQLPPLIVQTSRHNRVKIVGKLETVSLQGLIVFAKDELEEVIKVWPMLLVFSCLIKRYALPAAPAVVFAKSHSGKSKDVGLVDPELMLIKYLDYYFQGKECTSPLMPEWVESILAGSVEDIQIAMNHDDPFRQIYDEYVKWFGRTSPHVDAGSAIQQWRSMAQDLFQEVAIAWYPK